MKKKILFLSVLLVSLFVLTGCGKISKETISLRDNTLKYTTTFEYDKEDGFKFKKNVDGGRFSEIIFTNKKENIEYDMYYVESTSTISENVKKNRKNKKYYKEYKFGEYDAYSYGDYDDSLYLVIILKSDTKEKRNTELFVSMEQIEFKKDKKVFDTFNDEINQKFFNSLKNTVE